MMIDEVEKLLAKYKKLNLSEIIDHNKFNNYAITHHSTALEGSTLTKSDTELLLNEGISPSGKPFEHALMVKDHYEALQHVLSIPKTEILSVEKIQEINSLVMKNTGSVVNTMLGSVDSSKGEFRKSNVFAGDTYFVNYDKVETYTKNLVAIINNRLKDCNTIKAQLDISFKAHFDLVSIHPFYDGNGRTSRLLMNWLQQKFDLPLSNVFVEDKSKYIDALKESKKNKSLEPFLNFMYGQYSKYLREEIKIYNEMKNQNQNDKGIGFSLIF